MIETALRLRDGQSYIRSDLRRPTWWGVAAERYVIDELSRCDGVRASQRGMLAANSLESSHTRASHQWR